MIKEHTSQPRSLDNSPIAKVETIEPPKDKNPVLYMGGTFHDNEKNGYALKFIESVGRRVLTPLANRITKRTPWRNDIHHEDGAKEVATGLKALREASEEQTKAIVAAIQKKRAQEVATHIEIQPEKVTVIAQSADAQPAIITAHESPELIDKLVLVFPSGVDKKEKTFAYSERAIEYARGDRPPKTVVDPENNFEGPKSSFRRELGRRAWRQFKDSGGWKALISTISGYQGGLLHEMRQKEHAPAVAMVLGTDDLVAPPERVLKSLKSANDVDFLLIINSTHGIKGRKDLMEKILELTDVMEAQSQARQAAEARGEEFILEDLADRLIFLEEGPYSVPKEEQERLRRLAQQVPDA